MVSFATTFEQNASRIASEADDLRDLEFLNKENRVEMRIKNIFDLAKILKGGTTNSERITAKYTGNNKKLKGSTLYINISEFVDTIDNHSVTIQITKDKDTSFTLVVLKSERPGESTVKFHVKDDGKYEWKRNPDNEDKFTANQAVLGLPELYDMEGILQTAVDQLNRQSE